MSDEIEVINCPFCKSELRGNSPTWKKHSQWICPNKTCPFSNWFLPKSKWSHYQKVFDSGSMEKIRDILFTHHCSGVTPNRYTKAGFDVGFKFGFAVIKPDAH